jgi:hypothetical protein
MLRQNRAPTATTRAPPMNRKPQQPNVALQQTRAARWPSFLMKQAYLYTMLGVLAFSNRGVYAGNEAQNVPSDAELREKVAGTWIVDSQSPKGISIKGTVTILADKRFISRATVTIGDQKQEIGYEGRWEVKDGFLIETITKSNTKMAPVGDTTRDKIIRVNNEELVYQTEQGQTITRKRKR